MYYLHPVIPKCYFPFYLNCVGKMGNGKGLGNLYLCTEKLFWFSIWKYSLDLKYPMFLPVDFQSHCTIFSRLKTPSDLNYPFLGHFPHNKPLMYVVFIVLWHVDNNICQKNLILQKLTKKWKKNVFSVHFLAVDSKNYISFLLLLLFQSQVFSRFVIIL